MGLKKEGYNEGEYMKIRVKLDCDDPNAFIELPVEENETIGSIKRRMVEQNLISYPYKDCESYYPVTEEEIRSIQLNYYYQDQQTNDAISLILKNESATLSDCNRIKKNFLDGLTIFQVYKTPSKKPKFICSAPNASFELSGQYGESNIAKLRAFFINKFGSDCVISLKKTNSLEELILKNEDVFPYRQKLFYVQFKEKLGVKKKLDIGEIDGYSISKLKWHEDQENKSYPGVAISAGALAGLFNALVFSYLYKISLPETPAPTCPNLLFGTTAMSILTTALLGASSGAIIGGLAGYIYERYFKTSNRSTEICHENDVPRNVTKLL